MARCAASRVTAKQRMADYPDMPTFAELGHPEFDKPIWFSLSAPKGLPAPIVRKVNGEINRIMTPPAMLDRMRQEGMVVEAMTPAELAGADRGREALLAPGDREGGADAEVK